MLMALNSLVSIHATTITETEKQTTQLLNYNASHIDAVKEYRRSGMIIYIYSDASYISEPEARSRAGGYFFLGLNPTHQ